MSPWWKKGCHGDESKNDATATYRFRLLVEIPAQKEAWRERVMQDGGVLPTTGFPRVSGMETSDNSDTVQTQASHTSHNTRSRASSRWLYFPREHSRAVRVRRGSSCSRDGTGSRGTRSFSKRYLTGPNPFGVVVVLAVSAMVVVHVRRGT